jgi:HEAT repeat protein
MSWWQTRKVKLKLSSSAASKRGEAVAELAALDVAERVPLLVQTALGDDSAKVRSAAARALAQLGDARAARLLVTALENEPIRDVAIEALALMPALAIEPLIARLDEGDFDIRASVVKALVRVGRPAAERLAAARRSSNLIVRRAAEEALVGMGADPDVPVSPARLDTPPASPSLTPPSAETPLQAARRALMNPAAEVRLATVLALARLSDPSAAKLVVAALQDVCPDVRREAVRTLDILGWQPQTAAHRALLSVAAEQFAEAAAEGTAAVRPLLTVLENEAAPTHSAALDALCDIVERCPGDLAVEELRAVAVLPELRELAQEELQRRGLKA